MAENFYMYFIIALIPLVIGSVYYSPALLGNAWMKTNGFTKESLQGGRMLVIFGLTYVCSLLLTVGLQSMCIHEMGVVQVAMPAVLEAGSQAQTDVNAFLSTYAGNFRTFGHGAVHGVLSCVVFVLPILGIVALFERRGAKYIGIHFLYWLLCFVVMSGLIASTLVFGPV